jgi:hypothetical protein
MQIANGGYMIIDLHGGYYSSVFFNATELKTRVPYVYT